ncbi:LysR family transcriptional regulator [Kutzneria sp. CA-103260]|uniref:LysR family transcriptional regulator n=1 Tax=Kutzneria sp. CA-103260 TaxID=2802641 RepID=UPI001BA88DA0|nr:LysR substrate-binding domain-containing protein [Kutzneria sp. CA-103260]QUQ68869.1 LysR family transcriptional regulator [Kutzneria sp. CA-103260]
MELRHLVHFIAVAQERNFTRAAGRLNLVQSALSVSIRNLEKDLGAPLFDRTSQGVRLSPAGEAFLPEARRVLRDVETARDAVAQVRGAVRGPLRIGIMQSMGALDVATLFAQFHSQHPHVSIELHAAPRGSTSLAERIRRSELDLAFAWHPGVATPGVRATLLRTEPLALVSSARLLPPAGPVTIRGLRGRSFVELLVGFGARAVSDRAFAEAGVSREVVMEVGDVATCLEMVRAGFGFAVLPRSQVEKRDDVTSTAIADLPNWGIFLITSDSKPLSPAAAAFAAAAQAHVTCDLALRA